jgi:hypothetical protein
MCKSVSPICKKNYDALTDLLWRQIGEAGDSVRGLPAQQPCDECRGEVLEEGGHPVVVVGQQQQSAAAAAAAAASSSRKQHQAAA